jgi:hypothetical protein
MSKNKQSKSQFLLKKGFVLGIIGSIKKEVVSAFSQDPSIFKSETAFLSQKKREGEALENIEALVLKLDDGIIEEKKKEDFLAKSDSSRFLYLLAREAEWAYRHLERDLKNKKISAEELVAKEVVWKEINNLIEEFEGELSSKIERLRSSK